VLDVVGVAPAGGGAAAGPHAASVAMGQRPALITRGVAGGAADVEDHPGDRLTDQAELSGAHDVLGPPRRDREITVEALHDIRSRFLDDQGDIDGGAAGGGLGDGSSRSG
jgi:hypothetical protein